MSLSPESLSTHTGLQLLLSRCSRAGCKSAPATTVEKAPLCRTHFISACYARLDEISEQIGQKKLQEAAPQSIRNFLAECTSHAASQALRARELTNQERAQLLDILLSAAELLSQLRRSPRVARLIPVRLLGDPASDPWIEETVTQILSKHGAMLRCTHAYAKGETLEVVRLDTGQKAIARVVWRERDKLGQHKLAIEILNYTNFWNWN